MDSEQYGCSQNVCASDKRRFEILDLLQQLKKVRKEKNKLQFKILEAEVEVECIRKFVDFPCTESWAQLETLTEMEVEFVDEQSKLESMMEELKSKIAVYNNIYNDKKKQAEAEGIIRCCRKHNFLV